MKLAQAKFLTAGRWQLTIADITQDQFEINVKFVTQTGIIRNERFPKINNQGEEHFAMVKFAELARAAFNDNNLQEIEIPELIGKQVDIIAENREYTNKDGEKKTFVNIAKYQPFGTLLAVSYDGFVQVAPNTEDIPF